MSKIQFQVASTLKRKRQSPAVHHLAVNASSAHAKADAIEGAAQQLFTKAHLRGLLLGYLRRRGITQADLGRALGAQPPQVSAWLHGTEPIPDPRLMALDDILGLDEKEMAGLTRASYAANITDELERLFIVDCRRSKPTPKSKSAGPELCEYFRHPDHVLRRLMAYAEGLVRNDCAIFGVAVTSKIILTHIEAALRSCSDLNNYLVASAVNLFHDGNIIYHLRYPQHYYITFFLSQVSASDGPEVLKLQAMIFDALDECAGAKLSEKPLDRRVAQHALHLLARYRGDNVASTSKSSDPETRRMEYFGKVYRRFDDGPFEELCELIERDEPFAEATLYFDASHYGDHWCARHRVGDAVIPGKALQRHIHGLADSKASLRMLASARLLSMVKRYGAAIRVDQNALAHLRNLRAFIESINTKEAAVADAQRALLGLISEREPNR